MTIHWFGWTLNQNCFKIILRKAENINETWGEKRIVQDYRTTLTLFKYEEEKVAKSIPKGAKLTTYYSIVYMAPFIYYVSTFFGILDPPPLCKNVFIIESKQKLAFSDPPLPLQVLT